MKALRGKWGGEKKSGELEQVTAFWFLFLECLFLYDSF